MPLGEKNRRIWGNQLLWTHLEVKSKLCFVCPWLSDFKKSQGFWKLDICKYSKFICLSFSTSHWPSKTRRSIDYAMHLWWGLNSQFNHLFNHLIRNCSLLQELLVIKKVFFFFFFFSWAWMLEVKFTFLFSSQIVGRWVMSISIPRNPLVQTSIT